MRVAVVGCGYVGTVTGACLAWLGHDVVCLDIDADKIAQLQRGETPIYEPGLEEVLAAGIASGRLSFSTDPATIQGADVAFITVGTPPLPSGEVDLEHVRAAAGTIAAACRDKLPVVINKSTVPIGSAELVRSLVTGGSNADRDELRIVSNPEFLREGSAVADSFYPDRIVLGADDHRGRELVEEMYRPLLEQEFTPPSQTPRPSGYKAPAFLATDIVTAEMIKYAANAFLAMKISFINQAASLCDRVGADVADVARGIGLDSRIGTAFLRAGLGWGGSCFGKDVRALIALGEEYGEPTPLLHATIEINDAQRHRVIQKLLGALKVLKGRTVVLAGLAFKPDTDDLRDAPSRTLAAELLRRGAHVRATDPVAGPQFAELHPNVTLSDSVAAAAAGADAVILVTEWPEYATVDWHAVASTMRPGPVLVDARNFLDRDKMAAAGFTYYGIGRPSG